jgi:hypothetical protein
MRINLRKSFAIITSLLLLAFLSGCAAKGPAFTQIDNLSTDKGLVYIYRVPSIKGAAISYDIYANEKPIFTLKNGGYFPYQTNTGEIEFSASTEAKSAITVDVEAGQTYYIKGSLSVGFLMGRPHLSIVSSDVGGKEIQECVLLPKKLEN